MMRLLRKLLIGILIMVVLTLIKLILAKLFPSALLFHANFCGCLQLMVFIWIFVSFLVEIIFFRSFPRKTAVHRSFFCFLTVMLLLEIAAAGLLQKPAAIPGSLLPAFRIYYENYQRNILQYDTGIAHYDPELFYALRKGKNATFSNLEFSSTIRTDDSGFRNTGGSKGLSRIYCLGDSYTLGWGVDQTETYPAQLATLTGCTVINTGMSSYGTVREIFSVRKILDPDAAVIIQYCNNDAEENEAFIRKEFHLEISSRQTYDSAVNALKWSNRYFPGKYFCTIAKIFLKENLKAFSRLSNENTATGAEARNRKAVTEFLEVLKHSGVDFSRRKIFVMDLGDFAHLNNLFLDELWKQVNSPENAQVFPHLQVCRLAGKLDPGDFYVLDAHLKPSGQLKVAKVLASLLDTCRN